MFRFMIHFNFLVYGQGKSHFFLPRYAVATVAFVENSILLLITLAFFSEATGSMYLQIFLSCSIYFIFLAPKSLKMVIAAMKLKDTSWKESYDQPR